MSAPKLVKKCEGFYRSEDGRFSVVKSLRPRKVQATGKYSFTFHLCDDKVEVASAYTLTALKVKLAKYVAKENV